MNSPYVLYLEKISLKFDKQKNSIPVRKFIHPSEEEPFMVALQRTLDENHPRIVVWEWRIFHDVHGSVYSKVRQLR